MKRFAARMLLFFLCLMSGCTALASDVPYTVGLSAETAVYQGPGYDFGYVKDVGEDGVYTIIEDIYDVYGNLWGKLMSGAGWVELVGYAVNRDVPYTVKLETDADVCAGPGYDFGDGKDVGEDGVYTIVEESIGADGFLWGKLRSGAGWVRLGDVPVKEPQKVFETDYTVQLSAWVPVYSAPDYDTGVCVGIVGEDGVYTIVHETLDDEGSVWGELKSGMGWVDFEYVRTAGFPPMTAYHAEIIDLQEGRYQEYAAEPSEYAERIAFRANENLKDVRLTSLQYEGESYTVDETLCVLPGMEADTYFVAGVVFHGDMTTYGISCTNSDGRERSYAVMLSGRNGSVVFYEYVP